MRRVFAELGVPADALQARFVNGFMYTRLRPLLGADKPPKRLPPKVVLKLVGRVHPAFRARTRAAAHTLAHNPAAQVVQRWRNELRPSLEQRNRARQLEDPATLDELALTAHVAALLDQLDETTELHFWLHGFDLGPIARYLTACLRWGLGAHEALDALAGASPSSAAPIEALVAIRAELDAVGADPSTLAEVRSASPEAGRLLDAYLDTQGQRLATGYDLTAKTLAELPQLVLNGIRSATQPSIIGHAAVAEQLRARVPASDRQRFDVLLAEAREVMDMRDDNGPLTAQWPMGLLRRALLTLGDRLVERGRLHDPVHALDLTPGEARDPFGPGGPDADIVAARVRQRLAWAKLSPPHKLGPVEPQPPLNVLPAPLAETVAMVQTALEHLEMVGAARAEPLVGAGIGDEPYIGRARLAASAEEAIEKLEPGDVLVVRATSPAFNTVLAIAGAVVTTHGGALSHAAVLARELGIAAVVGAAGALDLTDGVMIEVDPRTGRVTPLVSA